MWNIKFDWPLITEVLASHDVSRSLSPLYFNITKTENLVMVVFESGARVYIREVSQEEPSGYKFVQVDKIPINKQLQELTEYYKNANLNKDRDRELKL